MFLFLENGLLSNKDELDKNPSSKARLRKQGRAGEMGRSSAKVLVAKPDNLSLVHRVEGENRVLKFLFGPPQVPYDMHLRPHKKKN